MKNTHLANIFIGLISGTSVDAIDAVAVSFQGNSFKLIGKHSHPISDDVKQEIILLNTQSKNELHAALSLDQKMGSLFAEAVEHLLNKIQLAAKDIQAIGSHGQTLRHQIKKSPYYTFQIADPNLIAALTNITTVADFRRRDMALGGQGAPLVPAFHEAMFKTPTNRVILNIGGISNLTILSADKLTQGFDTGPGNMLLDAWIYEHKKLSFDNNGAWAKSGKPNQQLLKLLLQENFFNLKPPKSTGRDLFNLEWFKQILLTHGINDRPENIQTTLAHFTTLSIADAIKKWGPTEAEVFVCGGGAHNTFLMDLLKAELPNHRIQTTESLGLHPDWVEACAFAWLAKQTLEHKTGNLPTVTGASKKSILGGIYLA
jgi:anhydro-N-acetylmuramic acid kinase